jgi:hypothetical protein
VTVHSATDLGLLQWNLKFSIYVKSILRHLKVLDPRDRLGCKLAAQGIGKRLGVENGQQNQKQRRFNKLRHNPLLMWPGILTN